jgi:hypothetical protein
MLNRMSPQVSTLLCPQIVYIYLSRTSSAKAIGKGNGKDVNGFNNDGWLFFGLVIMLCYSPCFFLKETPSSRTRARARPLTTLSQVRTLLYPTSPSTYHVFLQATVRTLMLPVSNVHFVLLLYLRFQLHLSKAMSRTKTQAELLIKTCAPITVSISSLNQSQRARAYIRKCDLLLVKSCVELCSPIIAFQPAQT